MIPHPNDTPSRRTCATSASSSSRQGTLQRRQGMHGSACRSTACTCRWWGWTNTPGGSRRSSARAATASTIATNTTAPTNCANRREISTAAMTSAKSARGAHAQPLSTNYEYTDLVKLQSPLPNVIQSACCGVPSRPGSSRRAFRSKPQNCSPAANGCTRSSTMVFG
jgi:hypothetical protein